MVQEKYSVTSLLIIFLAFLMPGSITAAQARPADVSGLPTAVVPTGYGVNIHFTNAPDAEFARLGQLGLGLVRMDCIWADVEKQKGVYNFSAYDKLTDKLAKFGIRPLYILGYGNPLYDNGLSPASPDAQQAFAAFGAAAAARYAGRGVIWEIWNEPNYPRFWKPKPDADTYAQLAILTAKAIRQADPNAIVVAPATSGQMPIAFLERVFSSGLLDDIDGVSVHPYRSSEPETAVPTYDMLRGMIARYTSPGHTLDPIVCSEWGYSTFSKGIPEELQAQYALREYLTGLASGVATSIYYDWKEDGTDPDKDEHHYGLVRPDLSAKPAYDAIVAFNGALKGYEFRHHLVDTDPNRWSLLFSNGDKLALVTWTAAGKGQDEGGAPSIRFVMPSDSDWQTLHFDSCITYSAACIVATPEIAAKYALRISNPAATKAQVALKIGTRSYTRWIKPDETWFVNDQLQYDASLPGDETDVPVTATWNGTALRDLPPIRIRQDSPITASLAPRPTDVQVRMVNTQCLPFEGWLSHETGRVHNSTQPITVPRSGVAIASVADIAPTSTGVVKITDKKGVTFARIPSYSVAPVPGFARSLGDENLVVRITYPNSIPQPPMPTPVVVADSGGPTPGAVEFDYTLGAGRRYEAVRVTGAAAEVPSGATAMVVWVDGNNSGVTLRARYVDATGQMFQPDLGNIDWTGWRAVTIDLTGTGIIHWDGANDGIVHGKLRINSLLLVDTGRRAQESPGSFQFAYPTFLIPNKK